MHNFGNVEVSDVTVYYANYIEAMFYLNGSVKSVIYAIHRDFPAPSLPYTWLMAFWVVQLLEENKMREMGPAMEAVTLIFR